MKRTLFVLAMFLMCIGVNAQRVAVLDFNAGVGVSLADVDGISAIFNTYFSPSGYTLVERTQIDKAIDEQNFQRGKFTESQMVKIGQILNVSNVVVGDINIVAGQYNVDVRVINVQSGVIQAAEGATWTSGTSYRNMMKGIAEKLANKIAINSTSVSQAEMINGHEYVDLGLSVKWATCNFGASSEGGYGAYVTYDKALGAGKLWGGSWRLPTREEIQELVDYCSWQWTISGRRYVVTGPNGNSISFKVPGYKKDGSVYSQGNEGYIWSSTPADGNYAYALGFYYYDSNYEGDYSVDIERPYKGFSVRLVSE